MSKILLIGGTGGLGKGLSEKLSNHHEIKSIGSKDMNVDSDESVQSFFASYDPEVVIYLSVYNFDSMAHKLSLSENRQQIGVNCLGLCRVLQMTLPKMRKAKKGQFIFVSSILSQKVVNGTSVYSSCKAFGERMMRSVAVENSAYGIRANSLQLGYFEVGLIEKVPDHVKESILEEIPLRRLGTVDECTSAIQFLMSNDYVTGSVLQIAGGLEAL